MSYVTLPLEYFPDPTRGVPVFNGHIYVGEPGTDPTITGNQKQVTLRPLSGPDIPTAQPIRTGAGGVALYNGGPVQVLVDGNYSLVVQNEQEAQVYYIANASPTLDADSLLLANLTAFTGMTDGNVLITGGRLAFNDGGGGTWVFDASDLSTEVATDTLSGLYAAPSSDPTGASGAWVRQSLNKVDICWFGAKEGVNNSPAIQAALDTQKYRLEIVDVITNGSLRFWRNIYDVYVPPGLWLINTELTLYPGITLRLDQGAELIAGTAGMTMVASTSDETNIADFGVFGSKRTRVIGGTINGNDLAARGVDFDTCAQGSAVCDSLIIKCAYSKWSTTCNTTADSVVLDTVASFTDVVEGDCLIIAESTGERRYIYMVKNFDSGAGTITLSNPVPETFAGTTIKHLAAGFTGRMFQQGDINTSLFIENHIGIALGFNYVTSSGNSFKCTDLSIQGGMAANNIYCGMLLDGLGGGRIDFSAQHTENGPEVIINSQAFGNFINLTYIESHSDADFEAIEVGRTALMQTVPLISNSGASNVLNIRWPQNDTSTAFRRLVYNTGLNLHIQNIITTSATVGENPSRVGDFALVEQQVDKGHVLVSYVSGPTNLTLPTQIVIFSDGTYNPNSIRSSVLMFSNIDLRTGEQIRYGNSSAAKALSCFVNGEAKERLSLTPGQLFFGTGSAVTDTTMNRSALGVLRIQGTGGDYGNIQTVAVKTTVELNNIADTINTVGKFIGKQVWDSTLGIPLYSSGGLGSAVWKKFSDDTTAATPV